MRIYASNITRIILKQIILVGFVFVTACQQENYNMEIFDQHIMALINAKSVADEQLALSKVLTIARKTDVEYGYRVFSVTKNIIIVPDDLHKMLGDELIVTILIRTTSQYQEYIWKPKDNNIIQFFVMP